MAPRIAVASRSRFDVLQQEETEQSDTEDDGKLEIASSVGTSETRATYAGAPLVIRHRPNEPLANKNSEGRELSARKVDGVLVPVPIAIAKTEEDDSTQAPLTAPIEVTPAKVRSEKPSGGKTIKLISADSHTACDLCVTKPQQVAHSAEAIPLSAKGVKFQDGLSPGQGNDGETVIPGLDRHNARRMNGGAVQPAAQSESKHRNLIERTTWTFIMIAGFIVLLCMGHPYMILLVMLCQTIVYKEVTALFQLSNHGDVTSKTQGGFAKRERWNKTLNWYFFVVTNYFLYGESIIYYFKHVVFVDAFFIPFARNHRFISFMLYVFGFMAFVANLQKQYLRQQFALFCWVHMTLLVIVVSSHFIVNNILEGLIWFFVPASLVICNDVMAYVCGKLFGKTPLIKLSPKKTVEGFVGAFFCTLLFALVWGSILMRYSYMICPAHDLGVNVFSNVECEVNPVFHWQRYVWPDFLNRIINLTFGFRLPDVSYTPYHLHLLVMATFASLAAPFGGFFASGFKRAFDIKDFGHSIPGHGGMTDRMDCQFMMGLFAYVYYSSLIRVHHVNVGTVIDTIVNSLSATEQLEVYYDLRKYLNGQGILSGSN
ncbi:phosphatidate cytidylyltransferase [Naganishia albida]|nr:phosphatidate cytidylyltransferase [Naganishia albida]